MIELEHSPLGGSAASRFLNCSGSFLMHREQLQDGTFEEVESEFAKRGTAAHFLAATCLDTDTEPFEHIGKDFDGFIAGWPDGIALDAVAVYVAECRKLLASAPLGSALMIEETMTFPSIHRLLKGTVDFGLITPTVAYLRDYKNGEGIGVAAGGNSQLLYYAFLLVLSSSLASGPRDFPMSLGIIQPNFYGLYEEPDTWVTTVGGVLDWGYGVLLPAMRDLDRERDIAMSDFVSGSHCQFCPVLLECPVMQGAFELYRDASEDFVTMLSNEELDAYYAQRENARRFMNVLETTVHSRLVTGGTIPSAKLVEKITHRVWKPGSDAALKAAFGDKAMKPAKVKSPAEIEKMSSRGKEMALEFGYKPESNGLSVAPISDPRPEAKRAGNAGIFKDFAVAPEEMGW